MFRLRPRPSSGFSGLREFTSHSGPAPWGHRPRRRETAPIVRLRISCGSSPRFSLRFRTPAAIRAGRQRFDERRVPRGGHARELCQHPAEARSCRSCCPTASRRSGKPQHNSRAPSSPNTTTTVPTTKCRFLPVTDHASCTGAFSSLADRLDRAGQPRRLLEIVSVVSRINLVGLEDLPRNSSSSAASSTTNGFLHPGQGTFFAKPQHALLQQFRAYLGHCTDMDSLIKVPAENDRLTVVRRRNCAGDYTTDSSKSRANSPNGRRLGAPPGDLYIITNVGRHQYFTRKGDNIYVTVPLTVPEAALGAKIEVPTVAGKAQLRIAPGTQSGQKFRLRGRGAPFTARCYCARRSIRRGAGCPAESHFGRDEGPVAQVRADEY